MLYRVEHFDRKLKTYLLIHGYNDNGESSWIINIKDNLLISVKNIFVIEKNEN